jgi:hypothetical protein
MGLLFTLLALASAVILGSHILLSQIRDSPNLVARSPYLYPPEQSGPVIPPGTEFPFRRLLRLAGLWWRYSNPPPQKISLEPAWFPRYIALGRTQRKTPSLIDTSIV